MTYFLIGDVLVPGIGFKDIRAFPEIAEKSTFYLPDKDFIVPYFSAHFIFHTYETKFCGIKKWYAGTEK